MLLKLIIFILAIISLCILLAFVLYKVKKEKYNVLDGFENTENGRRLMAILEAYDAYKVLSKEHPNEKIIFHDIDGKTIATVINNCWNIPMK